MSFLTKITAVLFSPKIPTGDLCDDSYLKRLARDYEAGKTKWVFARDMAEYYNYRDMRNFFEDPSGGNHIEIKVAVQTNRHLISICHRKKHHPKDAFVWDDLIERIGPTEVPGLFISCGEDVYEASYHYTAKESFLRFYLQNGETELYRFGKTEDEFIKPVPVHGPIFEPTKY